MFAMDAAIKTRKIGEYESFIDDLKRDLKNIQDILDIKLDKHKDWEEVKQITRTLDEFKGKNRDMNVRYEIGDGISGFAEITDYNRTFVCVGLDLMLEMDTEEAARYADIRLKLLKKEIEHYRKLAIEVKIRIKLVLLALGQLESITNECSKTK